MTVEQRRKTFAELLKEVKKGQPFGYLQFFAGNNDDDDDNDSDDDDDNNDDDDNSDDDNDDDSSPSLEEMIKNDPELRKQFNALFKTKFNKRLKGVDLAKAKELLKKEAAGKGNGDNDDSDNDENNKANKAAEKMERKAKRLAVKEYAVDNGYNPKLLARLVDIANIEIDDEGDIDDDQLAEVIDDVIEEFPELFQQSEDEDDEDDQEDRQKNKDRNRSHKVGKGKTNKQKKTNLRDLGKARAAARHKKD
ncbi:TPA: hypothetical protein QCY29_005217 [Bacillus toyonensis]|nr:hypothetical protein [Bacillus toyonensis]